MSDWQIGDLALCIAEENDPKAIATGWWTEVGRTYTVWDIAEFIDGGVALDFAEDLAYDLYCGFDAINYRKIKLDTEPCEEEFTALLKLSKKRSVKA